MNQVTNYNNNVLHGFYELKDSIGNLVSSGLYKNGIRTGEWTIGAISENGYKHLEKGHLIKDKKHGSWNELTTNNKVVVTANYNMGVLDGDYLKYNLDGFVIIRNKFKKGEIIEFKLFDDKGKDLDTKYELTE